MYEVRVITTSLRAYKNGEGRCWMDGLDGAPVVGYVLVPAYSGPEAQSSFSGYWDHALASGAQWCSVDLSGPHHLPSSSSQL
jgi:hypothetical protein